jgi:HD-like signal output (HDOD) protein/CheY-like chemotaxis protein
MITSDNEREAQILNTALTQRNLNVVFFKANFQSYVKMLQYLPDILLLEFPRVCMDQLHFVKLVRTHRKTRKVPIIGYGNPIDNALRSGILKKGVRDYLDRPIKFSKLVQIIEDSLKLVNKSIGDEETKDGRPPKEEELKLILDTETLPTRKIEIMSSHVSGLMAFPFTVARVLRLAEDQKSGAGDLAKVIDADPVISVSILKVANTVFFASLNRRIASTKDAIVRIGFRETKRIVMGMAVMELFDGDNRNYGFDRVDFWYHSLGCAILAARFAKRLNSINPEDAFLAGLLHDFGIILLDEFFPPIFSKVLDRATDEGVLFVDKETAMLGINHNDVVAKLFESWKMPAIITEAIVHQYEFRNYADPLETPEHKLAMCVGLGNVIAKTLILGRGCDMVVGTVDNQIFGTLKMPTGITAGFVDEVLHEVDLYRRFLKLEDRDFLKDCSIVDNAAGVKIGIVNLTKDVVVPPALYLQRQGFDVKMLPPKEKPSSFDLQLHIIVAWTGSETTAEQLRGYTHVVRYYEKPPASDQTPETVPVIAFAAHDSPLCSGAQLPPAKFLDCKGDLRALDRVVMELIDKQSGK